MDHWLAVVDGFLQRAGFIKPAIVARPPSTGFADIDNVGKVPVSARNRASYQTFLSLPLPRAFAVSSRGGWGSATVDSVGRALGNCQRFDVDCKLYAVDNEVVWPER